MKLKELRQQVQNINATINRFGSHFIVKLIRIDDAIVLSIVQEELGEEYYNAFQYLHKLTKDSTGNPIIPKELVTIKDVMSFFDQFNTTDIFDIILNFMIVSESHLWAITRRFDHVIDILENVYKTAPEVDDWGRMIKHSLKNLLSEITKLFMEYFILGNHSNDISVSENEYINILGKLAMIEERVNSIFESISHSSYNSNSWLAELAKERNLDLLLLSPNDSVF